MASEDRDRNFLKAMARQMRANAADAFDCPDTETLAAYHERMLSPEEMVAQKSHIAACPRCQEILANLEITEAIPVGVEAKDKTFAEKTAHALSVARETPVFSNPKEIPARAAKSSVAQIPKPKPYWRWVVPAGAIAAGLLVWVSIDHRWNAQKQSAKPAPVEIAENREQKAPQSLAVNPAEETSAAALKPPAKSAMGERGRAKQEPELDDKLARLEGRDKVATGGANARVLEHGPRMAQNQAQNLNSQNLNQYPYQAQNGIQNQDGSVSKNNEAFKAPAAEPAPTNVPQRGEPNTKTGAAPAPPPAPAANKKERDEESKRISADLQKAQSNGANSDDLDLRKDAKTDSSVSSEVIAVENATKAKSGAKEKKAAEAETKMLRRLESAQLVGGMSGVSLRDAAAIEEGFIHTPDSRIFWFVAPGGQIFKTDDGGKTIHAEEIGSGIKALGGSAPDAKTCWIVTHSGSVLLTVDGGKHWRTLPTPESVTFASVKAIDAANASISDASGQIRYTTSDGGVTWNRLP